MLVDLPDNLAERTGLCCYIVRGGQPAVVRSMVGELPAGGGIWLTLVPLELEGQRWLGVCLQLARGLGVEPGSPVVAEELAAALSAHGGLVLELLVAPGGDEVVMGVFRDGQRQRQPSPDPLPERFPPEPSLASLAPARLRALPEVEQMASATSGAHTELLFAQRLLAMPPDTDKGVDIFRFSERSSAGIGEPDGSGRLCLTAFDLARVKEVLRTRSVSQGIQLLDFFTNREAKRFLGPLAVDLPLCLDDLRELPGDSPLLQAPRLQDLAELLALMHSRASAPGNRLMYLDEVFFPLLNLASDRLPERLDEDELPELEALDLPAAMADQLPYHAPEGQLMESFSDLELTPLMTALELPAGEGGALWLLDPGRMGRQLEALQPDAFARLVEGFLQLWYESLPPLDRPPQKDWLQRRLQADEAALQVFFSTWYELKVLVQVARLNELQLALLFYE
jgi:hypothetical protein